MAALRARIFAQDNSRQKEVSRLAQRDIVTHTDTWRTFVTVKLNADGSGEVVVRRTDAPKTFPGYTSDTIHTFIISKE